MTTDPQSALFSSILQRKWVSPGPTIDKLVLSAVGPERAPGEGDREWQRRRQAGRVRVVVGPIGGGKSTGILGGTLINAMQQPRQANGVIAYRLMVLRDTYRALWSQFMPFWYEWFPESAKWLSYNGSNGNPLDMTARFATPLGDLDYIVAMRALGELRDEQAIDNFFRGTPYTDLWMEEGDIQPFASYDKGFTRLGRFPATVAGDPDSGATTPTLWLGGNQFLIGSWPYQLKMDGKWRHGVELFEQPSAASPQAENRHNLRAGYYEDIIARNTERTIRRLVYNEHTLPMAGKPVYPEFSDLVHCAPFAALEPDPHLPLEIGMDGGQTLNPAAAIGQRAMERQLRILDEVTCEHGTGAEAFARQVNELLAQERYRPWSGARREIRVRVDPSAAFGADVKNGEQNWMMRVEKLTGLRLRTARTNNPGERREALRRPMKRLIAGRPGLAVNPRARVIREGLGGLFHFQEIRAGAGSRYADKPVKNHHSHACEACEYLGMDDVEYQQLSSEKASERGARKSGGVRSALGAR